jgi:alanine racemase
MVRGTSVRGPERSRGTGYRLQETMSTYTPTWIEIDLKAIRHNLLQARKLIRSDTAVLAPVKANAYGHGILEVSKTLACAGVDYLGVSTIDEALLLRRNDLKKIPILMLGSVLTQAAGVVVGNNITQTVSDIGLALAINSCAKKQDKRAKVHVKIDTGMGRIGVWHKDALRLIAALSVMENIQIEGIFSHFSSSDENSVITHRQMRDFSSLIEEIDELGMSIKYRHMANSMAVIDYENSHMNLIRPGLILYGLWPRPNLSSSRIKLKPALSLKSRVVFLKDVPPGRGISYGHTHKTKKHTTIATIPIGYGDGLNRRLSNKGHVIIRGKKAPIAGRVCMDQIMVDTGHIENVKLGDIVTVIGRHGQQSIAVEEIAGLCDTIPYEVICWLDKRVPRKYVDKLNA